nr:hypothetical protein HI1451 - Haemophilus influenzae (strain Rd KW20) [Haemophilus influenzae]
MAIGVTSIPPDF